MERSTIFNGKIHYKWPFSIAMLVYQRVSTNIFASTTFTRWLAGQNNPPFGDFPAMAMMTPVGYPIKYLVAHLINP